MSNEDIAREIINKVFNEPDFISQLKKEKYGFVEYLADALNEKDKEIERLKKNIKQIHKAYGCEIRDPSGTIWEHATKVDNANNYLRERIKSLEEIEWKYNELCK